MLGFFAGSHRGCSGRVGRGRTLACTVALGLVVAGGLTLVGCRPGPTGDARTEAESLEAEGVAAVDRPALPARGPGLASLHVFPALEAPLRVVVTQPADGATGLAVGSARTRIAVRFNHPIVSVGSEPDRREPVRIEPRIEGSGRWLDASTWVFEPSRDLLGATRYRAEVDPALTDLLGNRLAEPVAFAFETVGLGLDALDPRDLARDAGPSGPISVTFNQAVDRRSVESAFRLTAEGEDRAVQGDFRWSGNAVAFVPRGELARGHTYTASIAGSVRAAAGGDTLGETRTWRFTVAPRPQVSSTQPRDGAEGDASLRDGSLRIAFNTPMAADGLTVTVQPTISRQSVWWEADRREAHVSGGWLASQAYTVTVPADTRSASGDTLGRDTVVRFTTAPIKPWTTLRTPGELGLHSADRRQVMYVEAVNTPAVQLALHELTIPELLGIRLGEDAWQAWSELEPAPDRLVRRWDVDTSGDLDVTRRVSTTLAAGPSPSLPAGCYLLRTGTEQRYIAVVSHLNLTVKRSAEEVLVWATRLRDGSPAGGVPVQVHASAEGPLAEGVTDGDGLFRSPLPDDLDAWAPLLALSVRAGRIEAAVGTDWNDGIDPWGFNLAYDPYGRPFYGNVYTDRPIYRAGQTVFFRAVVRADRDGDYTLPALREVRVIVRDPNWETVLETTLPVSEFGSAHGQVDLSPAARLGQYTIDLSHDSGEAAGEGGAWLAQTTFRVSAYRKPEFEVRVETDQADYGSGDTVRATSSASYYFGGAVSGAKVRWRLLGDDFFYAPDVDGWWSFVDYDLTEDRYYDPRREVLTEGEGELDGDGRFAFDVPADLSEVPLSQVYTVDVEVTDINNQVVAGRTSAVVHKSELYLGLRAAEYVGAVGRNLAFEVLALDAAGAPVADTSVDLAFWERTWYSAREKREDGRFYWTSHYTDTLVSEVAVTADAQGRASARFTPRAGGVHRLTATARDARGREARSATYAWVTERRFVNWRQENNRRISLVADRKSYEVGDTAEVLVPAPFQRSRALVTLERGGLRDVRVVELTGNSETLRIPIRAEYLPNVYVGVVLIGSADASQPPDIVFGYTNLEVSTRSKQLDLTVTTDRPGPFGPREEVTFLLRATDATGTPVRAEFSAALVDRALLALADDPSVPIADAFYAQRALGVASAASLVRSAEKLGAELAAEKKGGGGGLTEEGTVRRLFRDTAFWQASVVTDREGRASVPVQLPDNLTTWSLDLRGVTGADTLVGAAEHAIVSTKPLLVRPVLPRFLVIGDTAQLETVVNNGSQQDLGVDVTMAAVGLATEGPGRRSLRVAAGGKAKVVWQVEVDSAALLPGGPPGAVGQVRVQMGAAGGGLEDTVELMVPVFAFADPHTVTTAGQVRDRSVTERFELPAEAMPDLGGLSLHLAGSLAGPSLDALEWLEVFPYDCSEQTTSKFLANVAVIDALDDLAVEAGATRRERREAALGRVRAGAERLYALQNVDGSWGWWGGEEGRAELTAYALYGLLRARQAGFPVSEDAVARARSWLLGALDRRENAGGLDMDERAFAVFVLSEAGDLPVSRAVAVYERRAGLGIDGLAFLAMALANVEEGVTDRVAGLVAEMGAAADVTATGAHWSDPRRSAWSPGDDTRSTAVAVMTLARLDPANVNLVPAVRWLMFQRRGASWTTTYASAWSVLALSEQMRSTGELAANLAYHAELNEAELARGRIDAANVTVPVVAEAGVASLNGEGTNDLVLRKTGAGTLYYSAALRTFRSAESLPAEAHGLAVGREYFAVDPATFSARGPAVDRARIGDVMQVRLTLIVPERRHYVVVEDPIPAGFEIVDTTLKTTTAAARSPEFEEVMPEGDAELEWWRRPWWGYWVDSQLRDEKVALFATSLDAGTYQYTYLIRAGLAGVYHVVPTRAEEMYRPEVFGRSAGGVFVVEPR